MLFKVIATTAFMKGKLGNVKNEWFCSVTCKSIFEDSKRDLKSGEWVMLLESTEGKDWRWVAVRNVELVCTDSI